MKTLGTEALQEVQNLAAEAALDPETALAHAAELRALRKLHLAAKREHRLPLKLIQAINSLPEVADVGAWKRLLVGSMSAEADAIAGSADLASAARR